MKKVISTADAPKAIGPYSQALIVNGLLFTSGQIPIDPEKGEIVAQDITQQTHQVCKNLRAVLAEAGCSFDNVIKTTCFLNSMTNFAVFNEVYSQYFVSKPARSCVEVSALPKNSLVEIELIASINN